MGFVAALKREIKEVAAATLFFLIGFGLIMLILQLALADYNIHVVLISKAIIGSLIAAKVVIILNHAKFMNLFARSPGIVAVLYRSSVYFVGALVVVLIERTIEHRSESEAESWGGALESALDSAELSRALAVSVAVGSLFFMYNCFHLISDDLGEHRLRELFFSSPSREV